MFHLWLILLSLFICGCDKKEAPSSVSSVVLVTVGGRAVTQADFDDEAARRPGMAAEAVLSNLVERQAMLIRAEASEVARSPEFRRNTEDRLIGEWLATTFRKDRDAVTVTEEELQAAYNARREQLFTRPPLARYAILYRKGRNTDELSAALTEALARFEADRGGATNNDRLQGFGKIAADSSEDTLTRYRGGDIGWVGEEASSRIPAAVLAMGKLLDVGAVAGPVAAGDGVYVILKTAERDATQIDFKEAAPALRRRLVSEKQAALETRFKEGLMDGVAVVRKADPVAPQPVKKSDAPPAFPMAPVE